MVSNSTSLMNHGSSENHFLPLPFCLFFLVYVRVCLTGFWVVAPQKTFKNTKLFTFVLWTLLVPYLLEDKYTNVLEWHTRHNSCFSLQDNFSLNISFDLDFTTISLFFLHIILISTFLDFLMLFCMVGTIYPIYGWKNFKLDFSEFFQ